jgi:hypothetical protein
MGGLLRFTCLGFVETIIESLSALKDHLTDAEGQWRPDPGQRFW